MPEATRPTTEALYNEHWKYVFDLLPSYGVRSSWQDDVAQEVWKTVHERLDSYDPDRRAPRAWITGIVRKCAASHRRRMRRETVGLVEDLRDAASTCRATAGELLLAGVGRGLGGLAPDQQAMVLWLLREAMEDDEQFEAFVLHHFHGNTIKEIAAVQEVSESAVKWRIEMAEKRLRREDGEPKAAPFLGFGSLEALTEAMRPPPQPPERGAELWRRVASQIGGSTAAPVGGVLLSKSLLAGLVAVSFLTGAGVGAGAVLLWQAPDGGRPVAVAPGVERTLPEVREEPSRSDRPLPSASPVLPPMASESPKPAASLVPPPAAKGPMSRSAAGAATGDTQHDADSGSSIRLILQMRRASRRHDCARVQVLADEHARAFPGLDADAREAERTRCRPR